MSAYRESLERAYRLRRAQGPIVGSGSGASSVEGPFPLGLAQRWIYDRVKAAPRRPIVTQVVTRQRGHLDVGALRQAVASFAERHDALRTTFHSVDGDVVARVAPPERAARVELAVVDARDEAHARLLAQHPLKVPFDLSRGGLFRPALIRLAPDDHVLVFVLHHIVFDGGSSRVLIEELSELYNLLVDGAPAALPPVAVQAQDVAVWQDRWYRGALAEEYRAFWTAALRDGPPSVTLPRARTPRADQHVFRGEVRKWSLPDDLAGALERFDAHHQSTNFTTLAAVLVALLHLESGQPEIVIGVNAAARRAQTLRTVGNFFSCLPMRSAVSGDAPFSELLERFRVVALEAFTHQDVVPSRFLPADHPVERPPVNVMFNFFAEERARFTLRGLQSVPWGVLEDGANIPTAHDLYFDLRRGSAITGRLVFNADRFDRARIDELLARYTSLLRGVLADPSRTLREAAS